LVLNHAIRHPASHTACLCPCPPEIAPWGAGRLRDPRPGPAAPRPSPRGRARQGV